MKLLTILISAFGILFSFSSCSDSSEYVASGIFETTDITLSAETSGRILAFDAMEGDSINAGEILAIIDTMQLSFQLQRLLHQQAASDRSRPDIGVQLSFLRRELEKQELEQTRIRNLLKDGAATTKQLDDINNTIQVLKDKIAAQKSILVNSDASISESASAIGMQIRQVSDQLSDCYIKSPISGMIITKYSEPGEYAIPGKPLVKVADLNKMYLRAYFTSSQLADIKIGQTVTVVANFGDDRLYEYPGKIIWISPESEFTPKSIQTQDSRANLVYATKIAVKNDGRIKIGGYGNVKL